MILESTYENLGFEIENLEFLKVKMDKFKEFGLSEKVLSVLRDMKFDTPTDIQKETIPLILKGKDVIGNAATGSGKTFAFVSGILEKTEPWKGVQALVLTPTRELADQIFRVTKEFSKNFDLRSIEIYGGVNIRTQISKLRDCEIVIGTPGRILDLLKRRNLDLSRVTTLVLDEADRMVDMGFIDDVEKIISYCPKERQTLLFSATTSSRVKNIEKKHLINPVTVTVDTQVDPLKLKQVYYDVPIYLKFSLLAHLLRKERKGIVMVFCNTRRTVDMVSKSLGKNGIKNHAIHGGLEQNRRTKIIQQFHDNEAEILVCTNVAARGLDIKGVTHVYNYDSPADSEEYIHRIGRTARAGKNGEAISLISHTDYANFNDVVNKNEVNVEKMELPVIEKLHVDIQKRGPSRDSRGRGRGGSRYGGNRGSESRGRENKGGSDNRPSGGDRRRGSRFGGNRRRSSSGGSRGRSGGRRDSGSRRRRY
ncbi:ATP-dependent RNA helicase [Candidatus Pacearchaeota archaeon]|nr:ATP-dependent RNA helicase [Candidatus Pacearchaeota archaeon]